MNKITSIVAGLLFASTLPVFAADIRIDHAASHAMVPGAKVGDGYLTIINDGDQPDRLIAAASDRAHSVQLHRMDMANGIMKMREFKGGLVIPPHTTVRLALNYHLMFNNVDKPFRKGETIKATLTFEKAGGIQVGLVIGNFAGPLDGDDAGTAAPNAAEMSMDMVHMRHEDEDPQAAVRDVLKTMFETPDKPLTVDPITVQDEWAIAGWKQDGRGGRVLLKRWPHGWRVQMLAGDALKSPAGYESAGVSPRDAELLSRHVNEAEAKLDGPTLKLFESFEGSLAMAEDDKGASGHSAHEGHGQ
ncbi:copper uptake system-associated protein [Rhizobium sp. XQZ8]|uniref:copper uptake system-associated protein n=1 Tax=Rhizobium populisoli TaxID=2859785 RepID=UPI001CA48F93|nr:copper uptake system-associated protein [Rhizobium populisoli]MBW6424911.1 copper uptake system-associated protein [Rhizobium populisoli]